MTEFARKILVAVRESYWERLSLWTIGQEAFPEKWKNPAARGGLVTMIRKVGLTISELGYLPPEKVWGDGEFYFKEGHR